MSGWQYYHDLVARLNDDQLSHLRTINWLLNSKNRGQGRTFLLAIGFIREAIRTKRPIAYFDHIKSDKMNHYIGHILENLTHSNRQIRSNFRVTSKEIQYEGDLEYFSSPEKAIREPIPESALIEDIIEIVTIAKQRGISEEKIREAVDLSLVQDLMNS
jgi:hypothetical protein